MSLISRPVLFLRYVAVLVSPALTIALSAVSKMVQQQSRLCMLLCLPVFVSSFVNFHAIWRSHRDYADRWAAISSLILALDIITGSILLLTAVAGWFILRVEDLIDAQLGLYANEARQLVIVPLVLSFCVHYFLAFASLETGLLFNAFGEQDHAYQPIRSNRVVRISPSVATPEEKAPLLDLEAQPRRPQLPQRSILW